MKNTKSFLQTYSEHNDSRDFDKNLKDDYLIDDLLNLYDNEKRNSVIDEKIKGKLNETLNNMFLNKTCILDITQKVGYIELKPEYNALNRKKETLNYSKEISKIYKGGNVPFKIRAGGFVKIIFNQDSVQQPKWKIYDNTIIVFYTDFV